MRTAWLRILPVAVVAAHITACLSGLAIDWLIVHVIALLMVVAAAGARPGQDGWRLPLLWVLPALGWLLWLALNGPSHPPSPDLRFGRVAVEAAMGVAAAVVMAGSCERGLAALGQGVVVALLLAMAAATLMRYQDIGLGMMNHLLVFTVPIGTAWAVWTWPEASRRQRWLLLALLALVIAWSLFAATDGPRRGGLVALLAGCLAPSAWAWARRHPRLALLAAALAVLAAIGLGLWAAGQPIGREYRTQRIGIWAASWEGISAWWPWGGGAWSSLRLSDLPADAARVVASGNAAFDHPHNELLAVMQDQGLIGLLLALTLAALLVVPLLRLPRSRAQDACLALLAATAVFLLVENAYSLPACRIMLGFGLGLVGAAVLDQRGGGRVVGPRLASGLVLAGALAAAWAAWREFPAAMLTRKAPAAELVRPMQRTNLPQVADLLLDMAYRPAEPDLERLDQLTALGLRRFGEAPSLVRWRFRAVSAAAAKALAPIPGRHMPVFGSRTLADECRYLAQRVLHADPFLVRPYGMLIGLRPGDPQVLDKRLLHRAAWLGGVADLPDPAGLALGTLDQRADLWAVLVARLTQGTWDAACHLACDRLLTAAGGVQGVARLGLAVIQADPAGAAAWADRHAAALRFAAGQQP